MEDQLCILVIDDDEDDFVVTRDLLEDVWGAGVAIDWVATYEAGLVAINERRHDACLLDYHLGAKTGVDLMRELGAEAARVPIILMTGADESEVDLAAMNAGAADYLVKGKSSVGLVERSVRYAIARGQAEQQRRLASVVEFAHDAIIQLDADGVIRSWNAGAYRVFGVTAEDAVGQMIETLGCDDNERMSSLITSIRGGADAGQVQVPVTRADGEEIWVSIQVSPGASADDGVSLIARDITEGKQAELRRNSFVSIASHELRTPMTSILGFSELLLAREVPVELRNQWVTAIHDDGLRMAAIIDSLLNVSTIQSGRLELLIEPLDVEATIAEVVSVITGGAQDRCITVEVDGDLPAVMADAGKLIEVLSNLVGNALKYSGVDDEVHVEARTDVEGAVVVSVMDEGLGIAEADLQQLFTSFYRVRRAETVSIRGTGLGLYIVKALVEMMHGTVDVHSQIDVGSTFSVTLPAAHDGGLRLAS